MSIEIRAENFYLGMWTAAMDNGDLFGIAYRPPNGPWIAKWRFRYFKDDKVFNSEDERRWYQMTCKDGSDEARERCRRLIEIMLEAGRNSGLASNGAFIECMGDGTKMIALMTDKERPWLHSYELTEAQNAEYEKTGNMPEEAP